MDHPGYCFQRPKKMQSPFGQGLKGDKNSFRSQSLFEERSVPSTSTAGLELKLGHLHIANHHAGLDSATALQKPPKRPSRKSTSSIDKALSEIRLIRDNVHTFLATQSKENESMVEHELTTREQALRWLRHPISFGMSSQRRPSLSRMLSASGPLRPSTANPSLLRTGLEPPSFLYTPTAGAAARAAAAAAQNEVPESSRATPQSHAVLQEPNPTSDSESGIDIEVRGRMDELAEPAFSIARTGWQACPLVSSKSANLLLDPSYCLPPELMDHIFSYLNAASLVNADVVSHRWHSLASSNHLWRRVFSKEFGFQNSTHSSGLPAPSNGGLGFGKNVTGQDWRKLWKIRKRLDNRWTKSSAAAIYLEGHKDSVYCIQFDE